MALSDTGRPAITQDRGVGVWMMDETATPKKYVWVITTYKALEQLDPIAPRDREGAFQTWKAHRTEIASAASRKFESQGTHETDGLQEGQSILVLDIADKIGP